MNIIKELRLKKGITQHQLATEIEVSDSFISIIEAGKRRPSIATAKKIGAVLGCNWYRLFEEKRMYP